MKEIWKKHYEKIVLGVLALSFVFALLYLLQMLESASATTEDQLRFRKSKANYEIKNFKADEYNVDHNLGKKTTLKMNIATDAEAEKNSQADKENKNAQGAKKAEADKNTNTAQPDEQAAVQTHEKSEYALGLLVPAKMLRSKCCKTIMPWNMARRKDNQNAICPNCGEEMEDPLSPPSSKDYERKLRERDTDGDGMPDLFERRLGLNPLDAQDAQNDADDDGFSNLYEFISGTDLKDKRSYPSLRQCLYLKRLEKKELAVKLDSVVPGSDINDPSKKTWSISLVINKNFENKSVGEMVVISKKTYQIYAVEEKPFEKQEGGLVNKYMEYSVVLVPMNGDVPNLEK